MYWKVRKVGIDEVLRTHGVFIGLAVSVLMNGFLIMTRPDPKKLVSAEMKNNFDQFARNVTMHLLDTSYISYEASTMALVQGELAPSVVLSLRQREMIAKTDDEFRAQARALNEQRQVSSVRIDSVNESELNDKGMMPIEVKGLVAIRSAQEDSDKPVPFRFRFLVGVAGATQKPIIAAFEDASPAQQQQGGGEGGGERPQIQPQMK